MTSIERTAYPRFSAHPLRTRELEKFYSLTLLEKEYINRHVRERSYALISQCNSKYSSTCIIFLSYQRSQVRWWVLLKKN